MKRLVLGLYRAGLALVPREHRDRYGDQMLADLREVLDRRQEAGGGAAVLRAGGSALMDLVVWAAVERVRWVMGGTGDGARDGRNATNTGWGETMMRTIQELRMAARTLLRRPGFTTVAVLTLGLGMGSVLAIFTLVNGVLLQPLPFPESDRIVVVNHHAPGIDLPNLGSSSGILDYYQRTADVFAPVVGITGANRVLTGVDQAAEMELLTVGSGFFDVFASYPVMGRAFGPDDVEPGAAPVLILTNDEWRSRFGADPAILGRSVELDGVTTEIVGVMGPDFLFPEPGPVGMVPLIRSQPVFGTFGMSAIARLAPGVTLEQARAQVDALQARLPDEFPGIDAEGLAGFGWSASVTPLREDVVEDVAGTLWVVLGTVGFVLLIACANVANLFLVRAEGRQKEIAVRAAMGAGRGRVATSFIQEALVLSLAGGVLGMGLAAGGVNLLVNHGPQEVPRLAEVAITPAVLGMAGLIVVAAGLLMGLLPLTRYSARSFASILRDGGRGSTTGRERHRARNALVMGQLALALVLLVGSGLMFRSFAAMRSVELGFRTDDILVTSMRVGDGMDRLEAARFYDQLQERVAALPGVVSAGFSTQVPMANGNSNGGSFYMASRPRQEGDLPPVSFYRAITPGYMETMGMELVAGRAMTDADLDGSTAYVWVDEYFAETFFDGNALGERITWDSVEDVANRESESGGDGARGDAGNPGPDFEGWAEIAGVYRDVKHQGIRQDPAAEAFLPFVAGTISYPNLGVASLAVRVRPGQDPAALAGPIREEISRLNGNVPISRVQTMEEVMSAELAGESITLVLLGLAAGMALFLGAIGLFGVISYVVGQRTREIGLRMALGADAGEVRAMVLRQGLAVIAGGIALGLAGAFGLTRLMESILFEVSTVDPLTFAVAPVVLLGISVLATWMPAMRASRVDPMDSLRQD